MMMTPFPMLAESDPFDLFKDAGFAQWLVYAFGALMIWEKIQKLRDGKKARDVRVVEGEVEVSEKKQFADRAIVEAELKKLTAALEKLERKNDEALSELGEENAAQHAAARTAGEQRVTNITHFVETESDALKVMIHDLTQRVETLTAALHEKVNAVALLVAGHKEAIDNIKTDNFRLWSQKQDKKTHAS